MNRAALLLAAAAALAAAGCGSGPRPSGPLFHDAAAATGLLFQHFTGAAGQYYMPEIMGGGVALFDYDNDGDLDVYFTQGAALGSEQKSPGNRLFRNEMKETGGLRFRDVTAQSGAGFAGYGMGAAVGDYDNDGDLDLYVTNFGPNVLFRNNGNGTFTDVTREAGVDDPRWSASAAFLDYDRDGRLDLMVANYVDFTVKGNKRCYAPTGELDYCTPKMYRGVPSRLFRNRGDGRFADMSRQAGITSPAPSLGVACADYDGDGWVDVYVANDTAPNQLWINQRDGTFRETGVASGAAFAADGVPRAGMGIASGDYDNDGDEDLLVTNLTRESVTLYQNNGKAEFSDVTIESGLAEPTFGFTGFGTGWFDYDNDGRLDLFIANGAVTIIESQRGSAYPFLQRNLLLRNEGAAARFREIPAFERLGVGRGAAFGDIDNDGDVDLVVANNNGPALLLLNDAAAGRQWLEVRLEGKTNRFGAGARVALFRDGGRATLWRRARADSSYLSASDLRVHFGLGEDRTAARLLVEWPDGTRESWEKVAAGQIVTLRQGSGKVE